MLPKTVKAKRKPASRGQRKHARRMKQEARKGATLENPKKKAVPAATSAKE